MKYTITVRGPVPPDLTRKLAEAHALAIQKKPTSAVIAPVGVLEVADAHGKLPSK